MKKFILNLFLFILPFFAVLISVVLVSKKFIDAGNFYSISKNYKYIILGHSHPECAYNDSLIDEFKNFGSSGESYFYTYFKAKKIVENNKQIKAVFIEYVNDQIDISMNGWIWDDNFMSNKYPKYSAFMNWEDYEIILGNNWRSFLNLESVSFKNNLSFLAGQENDLIKKGGWGGYSYLNRFKTDSLIKAGRYADVELSVATVSEVNINYLKKTVLLCKENNIDVYLIRSPLHPIYPLTNENKYRQVLTQDLPGTTFLDFKDYTVPDSLFADPEHLNYKGAREFSIFFNELIKNGLLVTANKQAMIDKEMEANARVSEMANSQ